MQIPYPGRDSFSDDDYIKSIKKKITFNNSNNLLNYKFKKRYIFFFHLDDYNFFECIRKWLFSASDPWPFSFVVLGAI